MKRKIAFLALQVLCCLAMCSVLSYATGASESSQVRQDSTKTVSHRKSVKNPLLLDGPITDLGTPHPLANDIWCLTIAPDSSSTVVYGGTSPGDGDYGQFFKYYSTGDAFTNEDSIADEAIRALVTHNDSVYGGTMIEPDAASPPAGGRLFSFSPGDASVNIIGVAISGDSSIVSLTVGCGFSDSTWIYGGTGPLGLDPNHPGGGHLFRHAPGSGFQSLGTMVGGQRLIRSLTNLNVGTIGYIVGGTGIDSSYVFSACGHDCEETNIDSAGPAQGGYSRILGLCRVKDDTIYGQSSDSAIVFRYLPDLGNTISRIGHFEAVGETAVGGGPMVTGGRTDSLIYFGNTIDTTNGEQARFYEWDRTDETWAPGEAGGMGNYNPIWWPLPVASADRIRSLAVDSSNNHNVYIGTRADTAHLMVFDPTQAARQNLQSSIRSRSLENGATEGWRLKCTPNPFRGSVHLQCEVPETYQEGISLTIYDAAGRSVKSVSSRSTTLTSRVYVWDGRDELGIPVSDGVYLCELRAGDVVLRRKVALIR